MAGLNVLHPKRPKYFATKIWSSHYYDIWLHRTSPFFVVPYGTRQCHQLQIFTVQIVARPGESRGNSKFGDESRMSGSPWGDRTWGAPKTVLEV